MSAGLPLPLSEQVEDGRSPSGRATHEQSPQAVSAVPVGIPSAARDAVQQLASTRMLISMIEWDTISNKLLAAADCAEESLHALKWLVEVIDKAGLRNLSNGVQLGQVSWFVKADDALRYARRILAQGTEAGTAETEGLGPKDDGPVGEADAPEGSSS